ncbi:hypothetical protein AQUCO_00900869v1 [Aquilegia coerulea]|uniref:Uncharacterized protein n=1 Tax=Aquilegia coerulea TaxID=218851 RepID=A0A2G5EFU5_AQUCA|nr:hypothetical protein AQUCO_00900869v1 [Aquilegia coerulea]
MLLYYPRTDYLYCGMLFNHAFRRRSNCLPLLTNMSDSYHLHVYLADTDSSQLDIFICPQLFGFISFLWVAIKK